MSLPSKQDNQSGDGQMEKSAPISIFDPKLATHQAKIDKDSHGQYAFDASPAIYGGKGKEIRADLPNKSERLNTTVNMSNEAEPIKKPEQEHASHASDDSADISALLSDQITLSSPNLLELEEREATLEAREAHFVKQVEKYRAAIQEIKKRLRSQGSRLEEWQAQLEVRQAQIESKVKQFNQAQKQDSAVLSNSLVEKEALLDEFKESLKAKAEELQQQFDVVKRERRQFADLERQRHLLNEVKRAITANEEVMIKKWAPAKALVLVASLIGLMVALGVGSWLTTNELVKPVWRATALMQFGEETAESPADSQDWLSEKKAFILTEGPLNAVHNALAKYDQRELFTDTQGLNQALNEGLRFSFVAPRSMHMSYASTDEQAAAHILAAVSEGFVRYTSNNPDYATLVKHASLDRNPTEDERFQYASMGFGVSFLLVILFWIVIKNIFMKSASPIEPKMQQLIDLLEAAAQPNLPEAAVETVQSNTQSIEDSDDDLDLD